MDRVKNMGGLSLLTSPTRIETPYIKVEIGRYTFGVYQNASAVTQTAEGTYNLSASIYPNYVQSLSVQKINGQVNQYSLVLIYPIRPQDDPNFFEKVFSSVSNTRTIRFSYGDMSLPSLVYKNEEALITNIQTNFDMRGSKITYTVSAVSKSCLGYSGSHTFPGGEDKPSNIIRDLLKNNTYGLKTLFPGMVDDEKVKKLNLIPSTDAVVKLETKSQISILDYLNYLVSCMIPAGANIDNNKQQSFYILTIHDEIDDEALADADIEELGGPYFKITCVTKNIQHADAYTIDIGFPTSNIVMAFSIKDNENYSLFYNWQKELTNNDYVIRLDDDGKLVEEYSPVISSKNETYETRTKDKTWWSKITQYPISATIVLKGLLRPATLMQYVKLNVLFFGAKHIASGTYIVTKQTDTIDRNGYRTSLELTRVVGEEDNDDYAYQSND